MSYDYFKIGWKQATEVSLVAHIFSSLGDLAYLETRTP
jgi:hypothetical protein